MPLTIRPQAMINLIHVIFSDYYLLYYYIYCFLLIILLLNIPFKYKKQKCVNRNDISLTYNHIHF